MSNPGRDSGDDGLLVMRQHSWAGAILMLLSIAVLWFLLRLAAMEREPVLAREPDAPNTR